jgi:hypothetical protein
MMLMSKATMTLTLHMGAAHASQHVYPQRSDICTQVTHDFVNSEASGMTVQ